MKKFFFIALCAGLCTTAKSQIYVQAGLNLSKITSDVATSTQKNTLLPTLNAGVFDRFRIKGGPLDFETGLLIEGKGSKTDINASGDSYTVNFDPFYLEIPANLVYHFKFPKKTKLFISAGPYVSMALAGQSKVVGTLGGVSVNSKTNIQFSNSSTAIQYEYAYSPLRRFDYGFNFGAGLDFRTLLLKLDYGLGLAQVNAGQIDLSSNDKNEYHVISISFGVPLSDFK